MRKRREKKKGSGGLFYRERDMAEVKDPDKPPGSFSTIIKKVERNTPFVDRTAANKPRRFRRGASNQE